MSVKGMLAINDQIAAPSKRYGAREGSLKGSFQYEFYGNVSKWNKTSCVFEHEADFQGILEKKSVKTGRFFFLGPMIINKCISLALERCIVVRMIAFKRQPPILDIVRALKRSALKHELTSGVITKPYDV